MELIFWYSTFVSLDGLERGMNSLQWIKVMFLLRLVISGWQTFAEDWWTMLIDFGIEWTLNQSDEFRVINIRS
jgi:hypothetical protein